MFYLSKFPIYLIRAITLSAVLTEAHALENKTLLDRNQFSIGVSISSSEISNPDEYDTGFQFSQPMI